MAGFKRVPQPPIDVQRPSESRPAWIGLLLAGAAVILLLLGLNARYNFTTMSGWSGIVGEQQLNAQIIGGNARSAAYVTTKATTAATSGPTSKPISQPPPKPPDDCPT